MEIKIIVLGSYGVGKTSLLHKIKKGQFSGNLEATVAIDFIGQTFLFKGREVKVQFWDTAGQQKFNTVTQQYYRKAEGAIIVVSCEKSMKQNLAQCEKYLITLKEHNSKLPCFLLFNKIDVTNSQYLQEINKEKKTLESFKTQYKMVDFKVVSAKTTGSSEISKMIEPLVKQILQIKQYSIVQPSNVGPSKLQPSAVQAPNKEGGCC